MVQCIDRYLRSIFCICLTIPSKETSSSTFGFSTSVPSSPSCIRIPRIRCKRNSMLQLVSTINKPHLGKGVATQPSPTPV